MNKCQPITSKARSIAKANSDLISGAGDVGRAKGNISDPNDDAIYSGKIKGKDKTVTETVKKPKRSLKEAYALRGEQYKDLSFEDYSNVAKKDPLYGTSGGEETVTKTIPGDDTDYSGKLYKKTTGDVFQPWETRRNSRSIKKENRDIKKASKRLKRAEKRGNTEDADMYRGNLSEFKAQRDRNVAARASGKVGGTRDVVTGGTTIKNYEMSLEDQKARIRSMAKMRSGFKMKGYGKK